MARNRPHRDVADRLRFLLESRGLTREQFVRAIDGAIGARSVYSVLDGSRRPSRALAVLIERTWGLRADYLLSGEGEVWTEAQPIGPGVVAVELSTAESTVIKFMRSSAENSRTLEAALEHAQAWSRLFGRTLSLVRELDALGTSGTALERGRYPLLVKVLYEECRFMAAQYERLQTLFHLRRVHKLTDDFLRHFLGELPQGALSEDRRELLRALLRPVLDRRRKTLSEIEGSIDQVHTNIENLCRLGSLSDRMRARSDERESRRREALSRLSAIADKPLLDELHSLLGEVSEDAEAADVYWARLQKLLRDLLRDLDQEIPVVESPSLEELRVRYAALLDPLTA